MGTLYIVGTPIGNREDITIRALRTLFTADIILCEDTRRTGQLLKYYENSMEKIKIIGETETGNVFKAKRGNIEKKNRLISYYDQIEQQKVPQIVELLESGKNIALVSDAGTPLIADPGFRLVRECRRRGISVSPVPGPSSLIAALSVSGVPADRFLFVGYLPKKKQKRLLLFETLLKAKQKGLFKTVVCFETAHRINQALSDLQDIFGDTEIVLLREMTKMHEEYTSGTPHMLRSVLTNPKGEYVVIIS